MVGANIEHMSANARSLHLQGSLLGLDDPAVDPSFAGVRHIRLDDRTWLEHLPDWLAGDEQVFDHLFHHLDWQQRTVTMYQRRLPEPRLTAWWVPSAGPEALPVLAEIRRLLSIRYGETFDSIGYNCYRDGTDSVAWHGDRHRETVDDPIVAIVSVGAPRPLRLRPRGGGRALSFDLGRGDLFVMGGACQHDWEHAVPKVRHAEPRISITFRHGAR